jgi:hypothetical protein
VEEEDNIIARWAQENLETFYNLLNIVFSSIPLFISSLPSPPHRPSTQSDITGNIFGIFTLQWNWSKTSSSHCSGFIIP